MFFDLDWPLNASSLLSASAELLVLFTWMTHRPNIWVYRWLGWYDIHFRSFHDAKTVPPDTKSWRRHCLPIYVTEPNLVVRRQRMCIPKLESAGAPRLAIGGVADPQNTLFPTCVTMPNLIILGQGCGISRVPKISGELGLRPSWNGGAANPLKHALPVCATMPKLVVLRRRM